MRTGLLNELIEKHHITQFDMLFWEYPDPEEDDCFAPEDLDPQEVFNEDGVKVVLEWELGNAFITGLTQEEQEYLKRRE